MFKPVNAKRNGLFNKRTFRFVHSTFLRDIYYSFIDLVLTLFR